MGAFRYELSFRMEHPHEDLIVTCKKLGMIPHRVWRAGEQRMTPKGAPLEGPHKNSYCAVTLEHVPETSLSESIVALLESLRTHKHLLGQLKASGGSFNVFVGWFSEGNSGERFDASLLREMGELGISLDLDIYC
jgi:hypothetical protein